MGSLPALNSFSSSTLYLFFSVCCLPFDSRVHKNPFSSGSCRTPRDNKDLHGVLTYHFLTFT